MEKSTLDFDIDFLPTGGVDVKAKNKYTANFFILLQSTKFPNYLNELIKGFPQYGYTKFRVRNEIEGVYAYLRAYGVV